ncbi:uncharacterized protein A4U43_C07F35770 [Asparagus officinalis]|uniref:Thioredoxin domain-containing protein n=1 Tax=Asparagus officinalis TaxID=4686 RepID=A0A5P1EHC7_ASPOF|nr:thioredoxin H2-2-like [Asparagus officinalis]ONK65306.1 uncharacterized protein A4U43_C07F35770 [Asparagus officinalis]
MGSFLSSLASPGDETPSESSCVIAIHSRSAWDEHWSTNQQNPNHLMVIDFTAKWCGPCRFVGPAFEAFSAKYTDVVFLKVDVDELSEISQQWNVQAMPTFIMLKGGKETGRVVGAKKNELEKMIQQHLNISKS